MVYWLYNRSIWIESTKCWPWSMSGICRWYLQEENKVDCDRTGQDWTVTETYRGVLHNAYWMSRCHDDLTDEFRCLHGVLQSFVKSVFNFTRSAGERWRVWTWWRWLSCPFRAWHVISTTRCSSKTSTETVSPTRSVKNVTIYSFPEVFRRLWGWVR